MRLVGARIKGYRSIIDTGYFDVEKLKTILVGPNEAGKTAVLQALQKLNPPDGVKLFNPLRDYPRAKYDADIKNGKINPSEFTVVEGHFELEDSEIEAMPEGFKNINFVYGRYLNNETWYRIEKGLPYPEYHEIEKDILRLSSHMDQEYKRIVGAELTEVEIKLLPTNTLKDVLGDITSKKKVRDPYAANIIKWLDENFKYINEESEKEEERFDKIKETLQTTATRKRALSLCNSFLPKFILFSNYFRIKPSIHLQKLAERTENNILDDELYDYGNNCLLKFLGFTAKELSEAGNTSQFNDLGDQNQFQQYKDKLDDRNYRMNAATLHLTNSIVAVWNPKEDKKDANKLRIIVDGQYLKVVVEDELGVEVELDQRSEGFQWLVSFFIVFFAEATDKHNNAILLLDEPGMSLHALKQVEFQQTISKLSSENQIIFTTHSPFLVGANELEIVRVVEMNDRNTGTKVNTSITATDRGALLPLQEALGYDLAQSLFFHKKNLVLEGLTDYWYLETMSLLSKEAGKEGIDTNIVMLPANCASKVVYYATMLHAQNLNVAALLDSDTEGNLAASQDTLVNALSNKKILRTKDVYLGEVNTPEIEDLIRESLVIVAKEKLEWDVKEKAEEQKTRPIVEVFKDVIGKEFSKYKLSKQFLKWSTEHQFSDLTKNEQEAIVKLIGKINKALK